MESNKIATLYAMRRVYLHKKSDRLIVGAIAFLYNQNETMEESSLIFDWGTVPVVDLPKPTARVLVNYLSVKGRLRLGEKIFIQLNGIVQPCEVMSFELSEESRNEADDNKVQVWIEVELLESKSNA